MLSFVSLGFLLFILAGAGVYYLLPGRFQWGWLLIVSWLYYLLAAGPRMIFFLLFSTVVTFLGGLFAERGGRAAVPVTLLLNFGMLAFLKYTNFLVLNLNALFGTHLGIRALLLPLGISFYTFQSAGYLLDVAWKRCRAERSFFRHALFVSFFPQIMQGPIGRFERLSGSLFSARSFDADRVRRGVLRILWGFFKKMLIADYAAPYVSLIFDPASALQGYGLYGVLLYSAQLYADFSGGIDIVAGVAELFGITLDENFRQPFFAVSITDFWHRWHITLGTWMKDYLFVPISLSGWMGRFGKWCRRRLGKTVGRAMPVCVANIIVFLVVGVWHGPAWHFIVYGLYNGLIIGISGLLAKPYRSWKKALHINDRSSGFRLFQIVRTFLLVNISWFFDCSETVGQAFRMMRESLRAAAFSVTCVNPGEPRQCMLHFGTMLAGCAVVFVVSVLRERGVDVRGAILQKPAPARIAVVLLLLLVLGYFGCYDDFGGFIYANF